MKPIKKVFDECAQTRRLYPLRTGAYKLREALFNIERLYSDVKKANRYYKTGTGGESLIDTMTQQDLPHAFRRVPAKFIWELSYNILPALRALNGDGVVQTSVDEKVAHADKQKDFILEQAQELQDLLLSGSRKFYKTNIEEIEDRFESLFSDIEHLALDGLAAADSAFHTYGELNIPGQSGVSSIK